MSIRPPRIMQRRKGVTPYERPSNIVHQVAPIPSTSAPTDDIDEVLDSSGVYVQDGVMVRIPADDLSREEGRIIADDNAYEAAERYQIKNNERRQITVDDSNMYGESLEPYIENRLPGIADEVESYPCRLCCDKVFLTGFGLEKHAKTMHKEHVSDVLRQIRIIGDEWKRRNVERIKIRERIQQAKYRQEALAMAAVREMRGSNGRGVRRWASDGQYSYVISASDLDIEPHNGTVGIVGSAGGPFENCSICNVQINVSHPTALETHMRAHKRNDELRENMLETYGPEFVARLSCHECQLVFTDEKKLASHCDTMHVRRRRFVCKWCGYVTNSVAELNEHKIDVHAMPPSGGSSSRPQNHQISHGKDVKEHKGNGEKMRQNIRGSEVKNVMRPSQIHSNVHNEDVDGPYSITRTVCPECSLQLNRPSLLLKHMLRVHSKYAFSATIETKGLPSFTVEVDRGRVVWSCCERQFTDRVSFSQHRRSQHISHLSDDMIASSSIPSTSSINNVHPLMQPPHHEVVVSTEEEGNRENEDDMKKSFHTIQGGQIVSGPDGTIEVLVPDGVKAEDGVYMLVVEEGDDGNEKRSVIKYSNSNPDDMMRRHGMVVSNQSINHNIGETQHIVQSTQPDDSIASTSIGTGNFIPDERGQLIELSTEHLEALRMQFGDDLSNVQLMYVDDEREIEGRRIDEDEDVNRAEEEEEGRDIMEDDDDNTLEHDILEPTQS